MDFWYVKIEKIIGKVLFCHFFDNYGNSKRKKVWSMRLLKKKLKKGGSLVDYHPLFIQKLPIKEFKFIGFEGEE